jgi:hypothetical protein
MKLTVISLLILLFFPSALAINLEINSPPEVVLGENFSVKITSDVNEIYDIKIYIPGPGTKTFSDIFDLKWKSSFNYIQGSFPAKDTYTLRATNSTGNDSICVKLRKPSSETALKQTFCNSIIISSKQQQDTEQPVQPQPAEEQPKQQTQELQNKNAPENTEQEKKNTTKTAEAKTSKNLKISAPKQPQNESNSKASAPTSLVVSGEPILLNPQKPSKSIPEYYTKTEKIRLFIMLSFSLLAVLILILLLSRKL